MKEFERKQLLERIDREGVTVGATIPEEITVQGETVALQEFVFAMQRRDRIPPGEADRVAAAKRNLRRERLQRRQRLEDDAELTYREGEALADSIVGIDRALGALDRLEDGRGIEEEAADREAADRRRWLSFLRQVLGRDDADARAGGPGRGGP